MAQNRYFGAFNGYLPQATGLVVAFIRKESEFPLNRYCQYIPTTKKNAAYQSVETDQMVREFDDASLSWEDGASRKQMGNDNKVSGQYIPFRTQRRNRSTTLGYQTIEQAEFKIKPMHMDTCISQLMVNRTRRVVSLIETAANWGSNVGTANTLNGGAGKWSEASDDPASPKYNAIFKTCLSVAQAVHLFTNGKVKPNDLRVVLSPGAAIKVATSSEITNFCRQGPYSKEILERGLDPQYSRWGIPAKFKDFEFIVEDSMRVGEQAKAAGTPATGNRAYIKSDTSVTFMSRIGGLDGEYGAQNYSTIGLYHYGPLMKVSGFDDAEDELVRMHASEDTKEVMHTNLAGYLVTSVI